MDCILLSVGESFGCIIFVFTALELYNSTKHIPCPCFGSCDCFPGAVWKGDLYSSIFSAGVQVDIIADCFLPFQLLLSWATETAFNSSGLPV